VEFFGRTVIIDFELFRSERTYVPTAYVVFNIQVSYSNLDIGKKCVHRKTRTDVLTGSVVGVKC